MCVCVRVCFVYSLCVCVCVCLFGQSTYCEPKGTLIFKRGPLLAVKGGTFMGLGVYGISEGFELKKTHIVMATRFAKPMAAQDQSPYP